MTTCYYLKHIKKIFHDEEHDEVFQGFTAKDIAASSEINNLCNNVTVINIFINSDVLNKSYPIQ